MNIKEALIYTQNKLEDVSDSARIDAELLIMKICACPKSRLYSHGEETLSASQIETLNHFIRFRQQHQPIAHIIGYKAFWSFDVALSLATLIPRPATECLVAYILEHDNNQPYKILDLGTGSGAIAISLAKERPSWEITAVDLSAAALHMAMHNAKQHQCHHIEFIQSNWFNRLRGRHFDIIISNPPYIAENDAHLTQGDVQYEPKLALISKDDGYFDLGHLIAQSKKYLNPKGMLILEHGYQQQEKILKLLDAAEFNHVQGHLDLENLPRFCVAY
ncbi:MAG: peptide chain release factor N(5)-glutamine methyltransferase [Gammaproteobacteria bacterium]|nr:peptide chain release factor N(5)-glutamine methyltransferase [Gammaproteobacteria bacterium]